MVKLVISIKWILWRLSRDNIESNTFYEDLMVKLVWRLPSYLHDLTCLLIKTPDKLQNFCKSWR